MRLLPEIWINNSRLLKVNDLMPQDFRDNWYYERIDICKFPSDNWQFLIFILVVYCNSYSSIADYIATREFVITTKFQSYQSAVRCTNVQKRSVCDPVYKRLRESHLMNRAASTNVVWTRLNNGRNSRPNIPTWPLAYAASTPEGFWVMVGNAGGNRR